jgi:hypothetical protein
MWKTAPNRGDWDAVMFAGRLEAIGNSLCRFPKDFYKVF